MPKDTARMLEHALHMVERCQRSGNTTLLVDAVKRHGTAKIVTHTFMAGRRLEILNGLERDTAVPVSGRLFGGFHGPIVFDNEAIALLLRAALDEIGRLRSEVEKVSLSPELFAAAKAAFRRMEDIAERQRSDAEETERRSKTARCGDCALFVPEIGAPGWEKCGSDNGDDEACPDFMPKDCE